MSNNERKYVVILTAEEIGYVEDSLEGSRDSYLDDAQYSDREYFENEAEKISRILEKLSNASRTL